MSLRHVFRVIGCCGKSTDFTEKEDEKFRIFTLSSGYYVRVGIPKQEIKSIKKDLNKCEACKHRNSRTVSRPTMFPVLHELVRESIQKEPFSSPMARSQDLSFSGTILKVQAPSSSVKNSLHSTNTEDSTEIGAKSHVSDYRGTLSDTTFSDTFPECSERSEDDSVTHNLSKDLCGSNGTVFRCDTPIPYRPNLKLSVPEFDVQNNFVDYCFESENENDFAPIFRLGTTVLLSDCNKDVGDENVLQSKMN